MVSVVPAAQCVRGGDLVPGDVLGDRPQRLGEGAHDVLDLGGPPGDEVEPGAAPEGRTVDDPIEAVAQQGGQQVLDGVQARRGDGVLVGLDQSEVEVGDRVPPCPLLARDEAHVGRLHPGVVQ